MIRVKDIKRNIKTSQAINILVKQIKIEGESFRKKLLKNKLQ